ncbi:hypothetical protein [Aeromonas molluscorum]
MPTAPAIERTQHLLGRVQRPAVWYHPPSLSILAELAREASAYL